MIAEQARANGRLGGRPPSIDPRVEECILMALRRGSFPSTAAEAAGVPKQTFSDWMRKGARQRRGIYKEFYERVLEAMAEGEIRALGKVQAAADRDWKAAAWLLERRFRARWARQTDPPAEGTSENQTLHQHQHVHLDLTRISTPTLEFIARHTREIGRKPTIDEFRSYFDRKPDEREVKLLAPPEEH